MDTALIIPSLPPDAGNLSAALCYGGAGLYLLPVARGTKNPGSVVGKDWGSKSFRDDETIVASYAGTDHGIALDLGRTGLVILDVDKPELLGETTFDVLKDCGAPYQQTRLDGGGRGHYVFAQPPGRHIGCSKGKLSGQGLDVKGIGGVIILEPTLHPEGGEYSWLRVGEIPVLPESLASMLLDSSDNDSAATDVEVETFLTETTGAARLSLMATWPAKFKADVAAGNSRHDAMVSILAAALEEARAGYFPARDVVEILQEAFVQSMLAPGSGRTITESRAVYEFRSMRAWGVAQARSTPIAAVKAKTEKNISRDFAGLYVPPVSAAAAGSEKPLTAASAPAIDPIVNGYKRVSLTRASEIQSDVPTWAWEYDGRGRIQKGTLAILAGRPGAGKSNAARWFAAGYSNGTIDGCWSGEPVGVAYISPGEESHTYVIKPGLDAVAANLQRIYFPQMKDDDGNPTRLLSAAHSKFLQEIFIANKIRVVIVDPIMSTIPGGANINQNNETRQHVEPWGQLADAIDGIVLGVCHFVKFPNNDLVAAINGSSAFGEVARAIFGFVKDRKSGERVFSQVKNSTGMEDLSLRYEIASATVPTDLGGIASVAAFNILGKSELNAADILDDNDNGEMSIGRTDIAQLWLTDYLEKTGRARPRNILTDAKDEGHSKNAIYKAAKRLGVEVDYEGMPRKAWWKLPVSWYETRKGEWDNREK